MFLNIFKKDCENLNLIFLFHYIYKGIYRNIINNKKIYFI